MYIVQSLNRPTSMPSCFSWKRNNFISKMLQVLSILILTFLILFVTIPVAFFTVGAILLHLFFQNTVFVVRRLRYWSSGEELKIKPEQSKNELRTVTTQTHNVSRANKHLSLPKFTFQNTITHYQLSTEIPETNIADITITIIDRKVLEVYGSSFRHFAFALDDTSLDCERTDVTMQCGILNIKIPKKPKTETI